MVFPRSDKIIKKSNSAKEKSTFFQNRLIFLRINPKLFPKNTNFANTTFPIRSTRLTEDKRGEQNGQHQDIERCF